MTERDSRVLTPWVIGHRGAPGHRPEHSRASYETAIRLGVDAVEPDVVLSADGVPMVLHETELSATTDVAARPEFAERRTVKVVDGDRREGWFAEDFTSAELQRLRRHERWPHLRPESAAAEGGAVLTLAELIRLVDDTAVGTECALVIELKHSDHLRALGLDLERAVIDVLAEHPRPDGGTRTVMVESFEPEALRRIRAAGFAGQCALLREGASLAEVLEQAAAAFGPAGRDRDAPAYLSIDKDLLLQHPRGAEAAVRAVRQEGWRLLVWTLRPENAFLAPRYRLGSDPAAHGDHVAEWRELIAAGVDGVFVDHPDLFARALAPAATAG
ncbi:glycerophosphodiester phosphodiesterase [Microbacterium lushaniae]|nr:glycerophosphodiester phosphodiesterase [Microbacterium lushaniae]KAA9158316.1 glycerophosphodiester phosphodiesterase [Microbacterium lushaniae]